MNRPTTGCAQPRLLWLVLLAIGAAWIGSADVAAQEVFTPEHVTRLRSATDAKMSPDGQHIAYTVLVPRRPFKDDDGPAWSELHVVTLDGHSRPFVTGEVNVGSIEWTPNGKRISFLAKRNGDEHRALYAIPVDGGEARRVLKHKTAISAYAWSHDDRRIAFIATDKEGKPRKKLEKKGFAAEIFEEDWRPVRVWIGEPDKEDAEPRALDLPGSPSLLRWSPVGDRLLVALAPTPLVDDGYMRRKLHIVSANSGEIIGRIHNPGKLGDVRWSPDGRHLAVLSADDLHDPSPGRLKVAPGAGGDLVDVLPDYQGHVTAIAWQDSDTIMYLGNVGVWTTFGEIGRDGSGHKVHVPGGRMVLSGLSLSANGRSAAVRGQSPRHPAEVFVMSHGDAAPRKLTDNNPWLANMRFAEQEPIRFTARDGLDIEGILIHPLDEKPGQRYPLILRVHGGPEGNDRNGFVTSYSAPGQVAAARGFAVFYPNYRGSTGRGAAFSKAGQGDPGGKEFDDLVDGVDHLVELGLVDRARVGITGGSYGGFASAWCATYYTERFAAAVMAVGISDNISKPGTTDIPDEMYLVHWRKRLWDDWKFFLERSPIYYVERARTPILIIHGKNDTRVNPGQSLELYRHLKTLEKAPVRLVLYPGEGHGNRKAAARYDYNLRMMRWFEHYLKGDGGDPPAYELEYALQSESDSEDEDEEEDD